MVAIPADPTASHFLSGDWGTTRLRLRLVDAESLAVRAEFESEEGIARVHAAWAAARPGEPDRREFYLARLVPGIAQLATIAGLPVEGNTLVLSGMASSSIGLEALPYAKLPFDLGAGRPPMIRVARGILPVDVLLVSGLAADDDVMRGEETILVGLASLGLGDGVYLLPGTHSKHVEVEDGVVRGFRTYMTGEWFAIIRDHTVLREALASDHPCWQGFLRGVADAAATSLLHESFALRARYLLGSAAAAENAGRLSGLLIGSELADLRARIAAGVVIHLAASEPLLGLYRSALEMLGEGGRLRVVPAEQFGAILARGQREFLGRS